MGEYSDFYGVRGKNKRVVVRVKYKSGREETHDFGTRRAANKHRDEFAALPTVTSATIEHKKDKQ